MTWWSLFLVRSYHLCPDRTKPVDTLLTPLESETFTNKSICSICNCNGYPVNSPPQQTRHHKTRHQSHRWRFDFFVLCSLSYETYVKWKLRCIRILWKRKGTQKLCVASQLWNVNRSMKIVYITKIMISLRKVKPLRDFRRVLFAKWFPPVFVKSYETVM